MGVSVIMLGTGKQPRGKNPPKYVKMSCHVNNSVSFKNSGECGRRVRLLMGRLLMPVFIKSRDRWHLKQWPSRIGQKYSSADAENPR